MTFGLPLIFFPLQRRIGEAGFYLSPFSSHSGWEREEKFPERMDHIIGMVFTLFSLGKRDK